MELNLFVTDPMTRGELAGQASKCYSRYRNEATPHILQAEATLEGCLKNPEPRICELLTVVTSAPQFRTSKTTPSKRPAKKMPLFGPKA